LQGVRNKQELNKLVKDINQWSTTVLPINEIISNEAIALVENYGLSPIP
jgi:hypothetical protein